MKYKALALTMALILLLASCNSKTSPTEPSSDVSSTSSEPVKTVVVYDEAQQHPLDDQTKEILLAYGAAPKQRTLRPEKGLFAPYGSLFMVNNWDETEPLDATMLVTWAIKNPTVGIESMENWEETATVPYQYVEGSDHAGLREGLVYKQDLIEPLVEKYFGVTPEHLRKSGFYVPQQEGYVIIPACGVSNPIIFLDDITKNGDQLTLHLVLQLEHTPPVESGVTPLPLYRLIEKEKLLTVKLQPDGSFVFVSYQEQPLSSEKTKTIPIALPANPADKVT